VWLVFVLLYRHALQQGGRLALSPLEVFDTRASINENLAASIQQNSLFVLSLKL
jgi:hypothetical protein